MRILWITALLALLAGLAPDDGEREGRRGNELYEEGAYDEAAEAFAEGLAVLSEDASLRLRYGLHNNFGAALLKAGHAAEARQAFDHALGAATADADLARSAYNAGNAAYASEDFEAAVEYYRRSLLHSPDNQEAKFNYEYVKRQLDEQQENEQQQGESDQSGDDQDEQSSQDAEQNQDGEPQQDQQGEQQDDGAPQEQQDGESQEEPQEQGQSGQSSQDQLSEAQAERILEALQNEEEQLLREVQRPASRPRRVEKDW